MGQMIDNTKHAGLELVRTEPFPVLASAGLEGRAAGLADRCGRARAFLGSALAIEPDVALLVLSKGDWECRAGGPYGMPQYAAGNIAAAGEQADLWNELSALLEHAPPELRQLAAEVYAGADGGIDLAPFFDLLVVHELGHAFPAHTHSRFPRHWLEELFANLCLHAYVASVEPRELVVLETFPRVLANVGADHFRHRSLEAFEALYSDLGRDYAWFQSQLHVAAKRVHEAEGLAVVKRFLACLAVHDDALVALLESRVGSEVARIPGNWPG